MSKFFRKSLYIIVMLLVLVQSSFALNTVELSVEYIANPAIGRALSLADIYVGIVDLDPKIVGNQKQISVLQENGTTVQVSQPISTSAGGVPLYNGSPVTIMVDGSYSLRVDDSSGAQVYYVPKNAELEALSSFGSITEIKAITETPADGDVYSLLGYYASTENRDWSFQWSSADLSTEVAADTYSGIYIAIDSSPTGANGAFVRLYSGGISPEWFGAYADGTNSDVIGFQNALLSLTSGGTLDLSPGATYTLNSVDLAALTGDALYAEYDNITINGNSASITVTGIAECGIFHASAVNSFKVKDINFIGNDINTLGGSIGTAVVFDNIGASAAISDFEVSGCTFQNFRGDSCVRVERDSTADFDVSDFNIYNNKFWDFTTRDVTTAGVVTTAIYCTANEIVAATSALFDGKIHGNVIDANYAKSGIVVIVNGGTSEQIRDVQIYHNTIKNAGRSSSVTYGYGMQIYGLMRNISVTNNDITNSWQAGIYSVSNIDLKVCDNFIDGQYDNTNASLARGGVAISNGIGFSVDGNTVVNCLRGIEAYTDVAGIEALGQAYEDRTSQIINNIISDCDDFGISTNSRGEAVTVRGNDINCPASDYGVAAIATTLSQDFNLSIAENKNIIAKIPILISITNGQEFIQSLDISDNVGTVSTGGTDGLNVTATGANGVSIVNNKITGILSTGGYGIRAQNLKESVIQTNAVYNFDLGLRMSGTTGYLTGNTAIQCNTIIPSNGATDHGRVIPSVGNWSAGTKVEAMLLLTASYEGWALLSSGTLGTLNGGATTGGITTGTTALVVNVATDLTIGSRITIAGIAGVKRVTEIDGLNITIDVAANATVVGAAVAFNNPTVVTYGVTN